MRKFVLIFIAVLLLCACASNTSANQKTVLLTAAPTIEPTAEPTASPVPEKSGYFEIHTTTVVDAFGTKKREVNEIVALNPASLADGREVKKNTVYFFYDRGSRNMENSFFICIIDYSLPETVVNDKSDLLGWPGSSITSGKEVKYKIDDSIYSVTYKSPYILREEDFDRIYAALINNKDVVFGYYSGSLHYAFTIHGVGFADLVSSIQ